MHYDKINVPADGEQITVNFDGTINVYAGIEDGVWEEEEMPNWDVNSVLVDLSPQERKRLAEKLTKEK